MKYPDNEIEIYRFGRPWAVRYMQVGRTWLRVLQGAGDGRPAIVNAKHVRRTVRKYRALSNYRVKGGE